jgi:hypothetical protein
MPDLQFNVDSLAADSSQALNLRLRISNSVSGEQIQSASLNIQMQLQPARRRYTHDEKVALQTLFGEPELWHKSMRPLFWANMSISVPAFLGSTVIDLKTPAASSFSDAAITFCQVLRQGDIPLDLLFSGTVSYLAGGFVQTAFIPWSKEISCRIPIGVWRESMAELAVQPSTHRAVGNHVLGWEQILEHARIQAGKIKV